MLNRFLLLIFLLHVSLAQNYQSQSGDIPLKGTKAIIYWTIVSVVTLVCLLFILAILCCGWINDEDYNQKRGSYDDIENNPREEPIRTAGTATEPRRHHPHRHGSHDKVKVTDTKMAHQKGKDKIDGKESKEKLAKDHRHHNQHDGRPHHSSGGKVKVKDTDVKKHGSHDKAVAKDGKIRLPEEKKSKSSSTSSSSTRT